MLPILGQLGVADRFDTIVSADDTPVSKPDPAPYSKVWKNLTEIFQCLEKPETALAIEDTPSGIASAKGAGMKVLAVTNSYTKKALSQADLILDTLEGLTLDALEEKVCL